MHWIFNVFSVSRLNDAWQRRCFNIKSHGANGKLSPMIDSLRQHDFFKKQFIVKQLDLNVNFEIIIVL